MDEAEYGDEEAANSALDKDVDPLLLKSCDLSKLRNCGRSSSAAVY